MEISDTPSSHQNRKKAEDILRRLRENGELKKAGKDEVLSVDPESGAYAISHYATITNVIAARVQDALGGRLPDGIYKRYYSGKIQDGDVQLLSWHEARESTRISREKVYKALESQE